MSTPSAIGPRVRLVLAGAAAASMTAYCVCRMQVTTDITHFLPAGSDHRLAELSRALSDSTLTRTLILSIGGGDPVAIRAAATSLAAELSAHPEVAWVERGPTAELAQSVYRLYGARLSFFISERPEEELPRAFSDEALRRSARSLKQQLSLPTSPLLSRMAGADPLQWFPAILRRFEQARTGQSLDVEGDQLVTRDRRHALVFLGTRHSPFNSQAQAPLLADIARAFERLNRRAGGSLMLERGGVAPIAVDAEQRMRRDLTRISLASSLGVVLLFLGLFGSVWMIVLAFLPVIAGALVATTTGLLLFGKLHAITLTIGSTLIGVAIDYPILLLTHRVLSPQDSPAQVIRRVWIGIFLGGLTTAAGFAALAWTSFPGVREMAVTSGVGIAGALAATRFVLPPLLSRRPSHAPRLQRGAAVLAGTLGWLGRRRSVHVVSLTAIGLTCAIGLPRLRWVDSLAALNAAEASVIAETDRVRARVSGMDEGRFVIATARDEEHALRINDQIAARLDLAQRGGDLEGWTSLHAFLWSADLQRRNRASVMASPDLFDRARAALVQEGFRPAAFAAFQSAIDPVGSASGASGASGGPGAASAVEPLRLGDLQASPLAAMVRPFTVKVGEEIGILTFVRGVKRPAALDALVAGLPGARAFDQAAFLNQTYARFRVQILEALGGHLIVILLILKLRYRRWTGTLAAFWPAVLAASTTLALFGVAGVTTNLFHVMSLLLVLSMAIDYGVFLVESARTSTSSGATLMSLVASCATALLSFGMLALSTTPALRAIGLTTGVGILLSLVLAPLALVLTRVTVART
jgi:predicted exporter